MGRCYRWIRPSDIWQTRWNRPVTKLPLRISSFGDQATGWKHLLTPPGKQTEKHIIYDIWGGKKTPRTFAWPFFCYRFFSSLSFYRGLWLYTVTNIIDSVLQTLSVGEGGSKAGGDSGAVGGSGKGSFAAQRCRGQVLEKRTFFAKTLSFWLSFCYRFGLRFSYVFLYVEASMQCNKKRITRRAGSKWKLSNCSLYKPFL